MRLNGCLMELGALFFTVFITLFGALFFLGPAIDNTFENILEEFGSTPTAFVMPTVAAPTTFPTEIIPTEIVPTTEIAPTDEPTEAPPTFTPTSIPTNTSEPTATDTVTASPTVTETLTSTPEPTATATLTFTPEPTATATSEPTETPLPSATPTPLPICEIVYGREGNLNVRAEPNATSAVLVQIPSGTEMDVFEQLRQPDGFVWLRVQFELDGEQYEGWVRGDLILTLTLCPPI